MSSINISRSFEVPVEKLFAAWTEPALLKQWWKPLGNQLKDVVNDLNESGTVRYEFQDGLVIKGKYETVKPTEILVYTWKWSLQEAAVDDSNYKLHIHFSQEGTGSIIKIEQEGFETEEHVKPHTKGWEEGLDQLAAFVQQQSEGGSGDGEQHEVGKPPVTGYNETPEQQKVGGG
ncbi:SRPBCC family protein [Aridibaculum aurantiacum]|uniref:SRPBCC family protein n=1 Tax=Aridibaculum aurantiacum TaxID=2810307 RepID=UPI001A95C1D0|nr:SRPBCC domain-containing protein [Aridibaculum aurantiacum]